MLDQAVILRRSDNATFQVVAGEAIVIRMDTGAYYSLNEVGTDFWELLDGQTALQGHAATIAAKYNQKTADFIARMQTLALQGGDAQELADAFDVPLALVTDNLAPLRGAGAAAATHAATLTAEFSVVPSEVTADLLELAADLLAEKLVERC